MASCRPAAAGLLRRAVVRSTTSLSTSTMLHRGPGSSVRAPSVVASSLSSSSRPAAYSYWRAGSPLEKTAGPHVPCRAFATSRRCPSSQPSSPSSSSASSASSSSQSSTSASSEADAAADVRRHDFASVSRLSARLSADPAPSDGDPMAQNTILIDVREPGELAATGRIPGARNMPINSAPDGLFLPADEFEDRFGFAKPDGDAVEVVFYCKAGVRSRAAARVARMAGFGKVGEYPGSWVDLEEQGGDIER